ncbi:MAG TPA: DUF695 domain-containing protein [Kofleriaceae bacterium]|nr:DUF695 domain-containing protein [Kofleriaceae bacterium]
MTDAFDFYPCLVDGKPASIYVNLGFEDEKPAGADVRYAIAIAMRDAGPYGAGSADEADVLNAFEEAAIAALARHGLVYAGRVRTQGIWETTFYGPVGQLAHLEALGAPGPRRVQVRQDADPGWRYYHELLLPDAERKQWMDDRRLVQILEEQGDRLTTPRPVDHWAYFPSAAQRDAFVERARALGFTAQAEDDERDGARATRTDPIELDHIHDVVMLLVDAAEACGGEYDGWETSIER